LTSRYTILIVDDEPGILNSLLRLFRKEGYRLLTASDGQAGLDIMAQEPVDLVISDQRMPGMSGVEFLRKVKEKYPDTIRIVLSGYSHVDTITSAINEGNVYKFVTKPWVDEDLKITVRRGLEQYELQKQHKALLAQVETQKRELEELNRSLERRIQEQTQSLLIQNRALRLSQEILENLPVAVLGISEDRIAVLANRRAHELFGEDARLVGRSAQEFLPEELRLQLDAVFETGQLRRLKSELPDSSIQEVQLIPMGLLGQTRGVIITSAIYRTKA